MAFRSLSRPSSPPIAKASTSRPCFLLYFFLVTLVVIPLAFALVFTSLSVDLLLCIMSKIVSPFLRSFVDKVGFTRLCRISRKNNECVSGKACRLLVLFVLCERMLLFVLSLRTLYKGGVPAAPSGTATLLRLSPSYRFYPRTLLLGGVLQVPPASMA